MKVQNFVYNGFFGKLMDNMAPYTAEFLEWTTDPGVMQCKCSDGIVRKIPTFALRSFNKNDYPPQPKTGVLFGTPSKS